MQKTLVVFLEIVNSDECLSFVYNNYLVLSRSIYPSKLLAYNKLKKILKLNQKDALKRKKPFKGDTFITLVDQISKDVLNGANTKEDIFKCLINRDIGKVENLKKLCIAIINYPNEINSNWELIINNNKNQKYLFNDIECFFDDDCNNKTQGKDDEESANIENEIRINEYIYKINLLEKNIKELSLENSDFLKENKEIDKALKSKEKELKISKKENNDINIELTKVKKDLNKKEKELNDLKNQLDIKNKIIKNSILLGDFPIVEEIDQKICIIHTMPILMMDKIYYDIKFINYNEIYNSIEMVFKILKEQGITIIGIQSNDINSYRLNKIIGIASQENLIIYRIFFNTERELTQKILELEQRGELI